MMQHVDEWSSKNKGGVYKLNKRNDIVIRYDKLFNIEKNNLLNVFNLPTISYKNRAKKTSDYANYYFKYYDTGTGLLYKIGIIKALIVNKGKYIKKKQFISYLVKELITDDVKQNISRMVDDNYLYILDKKYEETEWYISDLCGKELMKGVVAINILYPLIVSYSTTKLKKDEDLYDYFSNIIALFNTDKIDVLEKVSMYVWSVIEISRKEEKLMWKQRIQLGDMGKEEFFDICLRKHIITDSIPSLVFDNNMAAFFGKVLNQQLSFYLKAEYDYMPIELSDDIGDMENISSIEKFEMSLYKVDETLSTVASSNIETVKNKLLDKFNMNITREEIEYYKKYFKYDKLQRKMLHYHFAKYFTNYLNMKLLNEDDLLVLTLVMKKRLQGMGMIYLPYILTGEYSYKGKSNKLLSDKLIKEIKESSFYQDMMQNKFGYIVLLKDKDPIISLLQNILYSTYKYVDYDNPKRTGDIIRFDAKVLTYEYLNFINQI